MELCIEVPRQFYFFSPKYLMEIYWVLFCGFFFFFSLQKAICALHLKITGASMSIKEG